MEEAHFQYVVDAELQTCNYSFPLPAPYSTAASLGLQVNSCCVNAYTLVCNHDESSPPDSTPFVSAPSSPKNSGPFPAFSDSALATVAAASDQRPCDVTACDVSITGTYAEAEPLPAGMMASSPSLSDFEFSSRLSDAEAWFSPSVSPAMSTAEELFYDGKIRPLNMALCSSASHCIYCFGCFGNSIFDDRLQSYQVPPPSLKAYTELLPPSQHAEQQHPLLLKQRSLRSMSTPSALEEWKKSIRRYDKGWHVTQYAPGQHVEKVMQLSSLPLAHYSRNNRREHGHPRRRARSLSPKRVFHIDEKMMQARASFESDLHTIKKVPREAAVQGDGTVTLLRRPRRSRKGWTLKELLNWGDNRAHNRRCPAELRVDGSAEAVKFGSAQSSASMEELQMEANVVKKANVNVGKRSSESKRWHRKSSPHSEGARSPWELQQFEQNQHANQQLSWSSMGSEEGQVEEMDKWNFVHDRKGWLGCLGFTDSSAKHNSSMKSLQGCIP